MGRRCGKWDETKWVDSRGTVAQSVVDQKLTSDVGATAVLLGTGELILAETNPNDKVWGVGMSAKDPRVGTPSSWPVGTQNLLGRCLMVARSRLRSSCRSARVTTSSGSRKSRLSATAPEAYGSYYDGIDAEGSRTGTYLFVGRHFGVSVVRGRGLHDQVCTCVRMDKYYGGMGLAGICTWSVHRPAVVAQPANHALLQAMDRRRPPAMVAWRSFSLRTPSVTRMEVVKY